MFLITSNYKKLEEFRRIIPTIEARKGNDLPEVDGTPEEVVIYKAIQSGRDSVVEDTILNINGEDIVDIKWKIDELKNYNGIPNAYWSVILGYNDGENIRLYKGVTHGIINPCSKDDGYGFDPYFIPLGSNKSFGLLEQEGLKDEFSPRKKALLNLKNDNPYKILKIKEIPGWTGKYQNC